MDETRSHTAAPALMASGNAAKGAPKSADGLPMCGAVAGTTTADHSSSPSPDLDGVELGRRQRMGLSVSHPRQVRCGSGMAALAWVGRVGWCGKAVVYASIGGLACTTAVNPFDQSKQNASISPQGAFTLLGTTGSHGVNVVLLIIMAACLAAYITWRFAEAATGQGYDATFSSKKNFFKYRVSPFVSGAVYVTYLVFICKMVALEVDPDTRALPEGQQAALAGDNATSWPASWRYSQLGRAGLAVIGVAFLIATCIQLQGVLTRAWHRDYRHDLPRWLSWTVFGIGHLGFVGRGAAFLAMAVLFFKDAGGIDAPHQRSMVANALQQLNVKGLRGLLFVVGFLLIVYGLFATLSAVFRVFPTPAPSRMIPVPAAEMSEEDKARIGELKQLKRQRGGWFSRRWAGIQHVLQRVCCCRGRGGRRGDAKQQLPVTAGAPAGASATHAAATGSVGAVADAKVVMEGAGVGSLSGGSSASPPLHVMVSSQLVAGRQGGTHVAQHVQLQPLRRHPVHQVGSLRAGEQGIDSPAGPAGVSMTPQQMGWPFIRPGQQHGHSVQQQQQQQQRPGRGQGEVPGGQELPADSGAAEGRYLVQQVEENRIVDVV